MLVAVNGFAGVASYVSNLIMARSLGPVDYGVLSSALAVAVFLSIPAYAGMFVFIRLQAPGLAGAEIRQTEAGLERLGLTVSLAVTAATAILAGSVFRLLRYASPLPLYLAAVTVVPNLFNLLNQGRLAGRKLFAQLAATRLAQALSRVAVSLAGLWFLGNLLLMFGAWMLSYLTGWFSSARFLKRAGAAGWSWRGPFFPPPGAAPGVSRLMLVTAGYAVLGEITLNTDVLVGKHFLAPAAAGVFALVASLGKVGIYLGAPVAMVMLAERGAGGPKKKGGNGVFVPALAATGALGLVITGLYAAGGPVLREMLGATYDLAGGGLVWFALGATFYAVVNVCATALCLNDQPATLLPGVCGWAAFVAAAAVNHGSPLALSVDYLQANVLAALLAGILVVLRNREPAPVRGWGSR